MNFLISMSQKLAQRDKSNSIKSQLIDSSRTISQLRVANSSIFSTRNSYKLIDAKDTFKQEKGVRPSRADYGDDSAAYLEAYSQWRENYNQAIENYNKTVENYEREIADLNDYYDSLNAKYEEEAQNNEE